MSGGCPAELGGAISLFVRYPSSRIHRKDEGNLQVQSLRQFETRRRGNRRMNQVKSTLGHGLIITVPLNQSIKSSGFPAFLVSGHRRSLRFVQRVSHESYHAANVRRERPAEHVGPRQHAQLRHQQHHRIVCLATYTCARVHRREAAQHQLLGRQRVRSTTRIVEENREMSSKYAKCFLTFRRNGTACLHYDFVRLLRVPPVQKTSCSPTGRGPR